MVCGCGASDSDGSVCRGQSEFRSRLSLSGSIIVRFGNTKYLAWVVGAQRQGVDTFPVQNLVVDAPGGDLDHGRVGDDDCLELVLGVRPDPLGARICTAVEVGLLPRAGVAYNLTHTPAVQLDEVADLESPAAGPVVDGDCPETFDVRELRGSTPCTRTSPPARTRCTSASTRPCSLGSLLPRRRRNRCR